MSIVKCTTSTVDWKAYDTAILNGIDIYIEAERLNIRFENSSTEKTGWVACHAIDREDENASAAIFIQPGDDRHGYYKDHRGDEPCIGFFELAARTGQFSDWKEARSFYADKVGVSLKPEQFPVRKPWGDLVTTYDYCDEQNALLFQVCRFQQSNGEKTFRQRRPDGKSGWIWNTKGIKKPPFRLPELLAASPDEPVFIVEGEKDVLNLVGGQFVATTCAQGAGKWKVSYKHYLKGRQVVILPDNDSKGGEHAQDVARKLYGFPVSIKIVELPGLAEKGDVSDWIEAGHSPQELSDLVQTAPEWRPRKPMIEVTSHQVTGAASSGLSVFEPEGQTELANSRRFLIQHGEKCLYCHPWKKWLIWDGKRWEIDHSGAVVRLAKSVVDQLWHETQYSSRNASDEVLKFVTNSAKSAGIKAMLTLAASETPIQPEEMDQNEWLLNCPNGTIDLRTGELREHRREDLLTKLCPVEYLIDSETYVWDRFLEDVFPNEEVIRYMQRLLGYALTGNTREHVLPIFYGKGANGKSTLLEAFMEMLGSDYALKAPQSLLVASKGDRHPTELADLHGKRFVVCTETAENCKLNEPLIKELTGGDTIRARRMREDFWQFVPTHKIVLCTNHKPIVSGTDNGIWRRLQLVPFMQTFTEEQQDKDLKEKLRVAAPGILFWVVKGAVDWCQNGIQTPSIITSATDEYRSDEDIVGQFIEDCCVTGHSAYNVKAGQLYEAYEKWCEDSGQTLLNQTMFGKRVTAMGYTKKRSGGVWYQSLGLKESL